MQTTKPAIYIRKTSTRSEEHTSELQSRPHLVCRLLLEKKKKSIITSQSAKYNLPKPKPLNYKCPNILSYAIISNHYKVTRSDRSSAFQRIVDSIMANS